MDAKDMDAMRKWGWSLTALGLIYLAAVGGWLTLELSKPEPSRLAPSYFSVSSHDAAKTLAFEQLVVGVVSVGLGVVLVIFGKGKE